jgi:hypothetical protein
LTRNNLQNTNQSVYKDGHSTETALLSIKNKIEISLAKGNPTILVMVDLSAVFDTIDHFTLLDCLSKWFGFSGSVMCWFQSYLCDRFQRVQINGPLVQFSSPLWCTPRICSRSHFIFTTSLLLFSATSDVI